ncbi:MAG: hypothetical protein AABY10_01315, partial [Nanoarchaeota archaeon]
LDVIKAELDYIKEHMVDVDTILTSEEEEILEQSIKEFKEGKTTSLEELEKERENAKYRVFK